MSFKVYRMDVSPYQASTFKHLEKKELESLNNIQYIDSIFENPNILITNSNSKIESIPGKVFSQLKLIIHPNSGYDNYSSEFVRECPCPIVVGNPIRQHAVANYIHSCLFHRFSQVPFSGNWDLKRTWKRKLLINQNVLLIGLGHIGKIIEKSLSPLVNKIHVVDPYQGKLKYLNKAPLSDCNIVIVCAGLNPTSKNIIQKEILKSLPKHVTIINGARGKLIQQEDLFEFLKDQPQSAAYLDVFQTEPFNEKIPLKNLFRSSHIAGVFTGLDQSILDFEKKVLQHFIQYEDAPHTFLALYKDLILKYRINENFLI